jgi:hypothetical protein
VPPVLAAWLRPHGPACLLRRAAVLCPWDLSREEWTGHKGGEKAGQHFSLFFFIDLDPEVRSTSRPEGKKLNKRPVFINYYLHFFLIIIN